MPRHHASHRDCRRLLIQIAALHAALDREILRSVGGDRFPQLPIRVLEDGL
jgi:hypothetical protein